MGMFDFIAAANPTAMLGSAVALGSSALSYAGQREANSTNKDIANRQMDFQKEMSSTAYQRAVSDMRAAGLNPALAYQQGGASTPPGASTTVQSELGAGVNGALTTLKLGSELMNDMTARDKVRSETNLNDALSLKAGQDTRTSSSSAAKIEQEIDNLKIEQRRLIAQIANLQASTVTYSSQFELNKAKERLAEVEGRLAEYNIPAARNAAAAADTWFGRNVMPYLGSAVKAAGSAAALGTLRGRRSGGITINNNRGGYSPNYGLNPDLMR